MNATEAVDLRTGRCLGGPITNLDFVGNAGAIHMIVPAPTGVEG
ncbi:MAG: hypothetical protein R8G66_07785 [Cytophagales bacterium]|nr:hypothetical protein [Cytophagales bacterium]